MNFWLLCLCFDLCSLSNWILNFFIFWISMWILFISVCSSITRENIVKKMFYCEVPLNDFIFKQSENATSFFILERGSMEVIVNDKSKRELKAGDGFGELALLYNAPRSASVKALDHCNLWGIDRNTFRRAVEEMITKEYEENRKFMEVVRFFRKIGKREENLINWINCFIFGIFKTISRMSRRMLSLQCWLSRSSTKTKSSSLKVTLLLHSTSLKK